MKILIGLLLLIGTLTASAEEIKLLTWNVFMLPKPINFTKQAERTPMIAAELKKSDYDFIVLQEAWIARFRNTVTKELKDKYPYSIHLPRVRRLFKLLNSGLLILSRHPFEVLNHHYYNNCTHSDCFSSKGVLLIEATLPSGKKVQIATSHLQAWNDKKALEVRKFQLEEANDLFKTYSRPGVPLIFAGDFNIDGKLDLEYPGALKLLGMESTPLQGTLDYTNSFPIECYKTPGEPEAPEWLDHVWIKANETKTEIISKVVKPFMGKFGDKECSLSDHYSVEAVIGL